MELVQATKVESQTLQVRRCSCCSRGILHRHPKYHNRRCHCDIIRHSSQSYKTQGDGHMDRPSSCKRLMPNHSKPSTASGRDKIRYAKLSLSDKKSAAAPVFYQAIRATLLLSKALGLGVFFGLAIRFFGYDTYSILFRVLAFDVVLGAGVLPVVNGTLLGLQMFKETAAIGIASTLIGSPYHYPSASELYWPHRGVGHIRPRRAKAVWVKLLPAI